MIKLQSDSTDEVVEVALSEAKLDAFFVIGSEFKAVDDFEHEEEGWGRAIGLFIFLFC